MITDLLAKRDGEPPSFADFERIYGQTGNGSEAIDETGSTGYGRSNNGGSSVPNFFEISKLLNFEGEENAAYKPPDGMLLQSLLPFLMTNSISKFKVWYT